MFSDPDEEEGGDHHRQRRREAPQDHGEGAANHSGGAHEPVPVLRNETAWDAAASVTPPL